MSVPIPNYLKDIAVLEKQKETWVHFAVKCTCGCNKFLVFQNYFNREEKLMEKPYNDALMQIYCSNYARTTTKDEDGKVHYWRLYEPSKGLEGKHEEIIVPERPVFSGIAVIKIKCADCGREYVIFDSRIHGYDGMTGEEDKEAMGYVPHFKLKCKEAVSLSIKIENDESFDEFQENTDLGFTEEQYSDAFGWILVYKVDENGKKVKIFDWETA